MRISGIPLRGLRRRQRLLVVAGSLSVAVGLAVLPAAQGHHEAGPRRAAAVPPEDDYTAAEVEVDRLVRLVRPPAGSHPHLVIPDSPVKGAVATSRDRYRVGANRVWTVSLPSAQAVAWLKSYDPPGFAGQGVVLDNAPGTIASYLGLWGPDWDGRGQLQWASRGFSDVRPSPIWSSARLSIGFGSVNDPPGGLNLEVSALVTLRGQDPKRDDVGGPRLQMPADRPCPADLGGAIGVVNPGQPDLDRMLVPPSNPSGGRLCFYGDYTTSSDDPTHSVGGPSTLKSQLVLDQAKAARLAGIVRTLELGHAEYTGLQSGLSGGPGATVLVLAYPGRPDVDLWSYDEGTRGMVANGHIEAEGDGFSYVLGDLEGPMPAGDSPG